jgi:hypothetical protein
MESRTIMTMDWSVNLLAILQVSIDELLVGGVNKGAFSEAKAAIRLCYALPETRKRRYAMIDGRDIEQSIESASTYDREYLFYLLGSIGAGVTQPQGAGKATEWGKDFVARFREQLKKSICSKGGPYDSFLKGLAAEKDIPKLIAISILGGVPEIAAMTAAKMIAVYIALIVVKSGIAAYCKSDGKL